MSTRLSNTDVLGLGFMTFAFFLGAGNIIFPPLAGAQAGTAMLPAMLGFLATAVGLPLITLLAVAKAGGGISVMSKYLPAGVATVFALAVYIVIGPSFATPRTGLVAYEIGIQPFIDSPGAGSLAVFSVVFFVIAGALAIKPGKLLDYIGKVITPLLILLLFALAITVTFAPLGDLGVASGDYLTHPFVKGFQEGYNTMDTLGSLIFGMLVINVMVSKGVTAKADIYKYLMIAGTIAAIGLAVVYVSLFYLGATSQGVAPGSSNGPEILTLYIIELFGTPGLIALAFAVVMACLTTAVGLVSAMAGFLNQLRPEWNYTWLVVINCCLCALVMNVGLSQLIALSVPVLFAIYPVAIALVALTLCKDLLANKALSYKFVMVVALMMGMLESMKAIGFEMSSFNYLPLFEIGMAWCLPTLVALLVAIFGFKKAPQKAALASD